MMSAFTSALKNLLDSPAVLVAAFALSLSLGIAEGRSWTNQAGTRIEAEMTGVEGDKVMLQMNGKVFPVPIASLSAEDQAFIKSWKPEAVGNPSVVARATAGNPKKGFCLSSRNRDGWANQLQTLKATWFYQWKSKVSDGAPVGIEFVPMVFGKPNEIGPSVAYVLEAKESERFKYLLGYNEPDKTDQANMTVEAALEAWPKLMSTGLPLISPAAANPDGEWMEAFMAGVKERGYRVDFIAIHSYGGPNPIAFLANLERIHRKFDLPLWITEFAVADWQANSIAENKHTTKSVKEFMKAVLPKLDRLKYVHRYAWFSASPSDPHLGSSALFNDDGSLTELGEVYAKD
ncbi:MAG: hypothetical protein KDK97_08735 [Verrucomicrobiales bacterium]|nr:hypothetical protein [Verrucomicrobiales bacterium]